MSRQAVPRRKGFHATGAGWLDDGTLRYVIWERDKLRAAPPPDQAEAPPAERPRQSLLL